MTEEQPPLSADQLRAAIAKAQAGLFEPTGVVMHPKDHQFVWVVAEVRHIASVNVDVFERRARQRAIADAYGIPHWMAGVDGAKAPLRVRARRLRRRVVRRLLPEFGLTRWGPRRTGDWWDDGPPEPRGGWLFVHVRGWRLGWGPEKEYY